MLRPTNLAAIVVGIAVVGLVHVDAFLGPSARLPRPALAMQRSLSLHSRWYENLSLWYGHVFSVTLWCVVQVALTYPALHLHSVAP